MTDVAIPKNSVIVITGATSGHGLYLAQHLSRQHKVLIHGRDRERTEKLAQDLGAKAFVADFADLGQVRQLATSLISESPSIDILINNAGLGYGTEREVSSEGYELRFTVNYLAPILLSRLLLNRVKSQILNIGSAGQDSLDFNDLMLERSYDGLKAYRRAKLALAMATFDLARLAPKLRINVIHPATYMDTNMVRRGGGTPLHTVAYGGDATLKVLQSPLTGTFFNETIPTKAHPEAYRDDLLRQLHIATDALLSPSDPL